MAALPVLSQSFEALSLLTAAHPLMAAEFFQTQPGQFQGEVLGVALPNGYFWRSRWNFGGPGRANLREGYLMVGLPSLPFRDFWHGREILQETVATATHQLGLEHRCRRDHESLAWMIGWPRIHHVCQRLGVVLPDSLGLEPVQSGNAQALRLLRRDIEEFIAHAPKNGQLSQPLASWFEEFLITRMVTSLSPAAKEKKTPRASASRAREICLSLHQRTHAPLSLSDLCEEMQLHERTLRYHFTSQYNLSPQTYHQNLRLNLLRQELLLSEQNKGTISHCAARLGFWHMGRMGQQYRRLFGESPKDTLARQVCGRFGRFWQGFFPKL